jgi:hypothetical protein
VGCHVKYLLRKRREGQNYIYKMEGSLDFFRKEGIKHLHEIGIGRDYNIYMKVVFYSSPPINKSSGLYGKKLHF